MRPDLDRSATEPVETRHVDNESDIHPALSLLTEVLGLLAAFPSDILVEGRGTQIQTEREPL